MNVLCISASNSRKPLEDSVSYKVCKLIRSNLNSSGLSSSNAVEIISLKDYPLNVCMLCGDCSSSGVCPMDEAFQNVYSKVLQADQIFFVVPHYSPLPSKLMIIFEKMNEIAYGRWLTSPQLESPFLNKSFAVIGHGGMAETDKVLSYYHETLVKPVSNTLKSLGFQPLMDNEGKEMNVVFGLRDENALQTVAGSVFPDILLDESRIETRLANSLMACKPCDI